MQKDGADFAEALFIRRRQDGTEFREIVGDSAADDIVRDTSAESRSPHVPLSLPVSLD